MIVNFTKEQIDFVKHCGEHFEVLTGGRGHNKTKQIIEELQQENKALKETLKQLYRIHSTSNMSEEEWLDYAIKYNSGQLGGKE